MKTWKYNFLSLYNAIFMYDFKTDHLVLDKELV